LDFGKKTKDDVTTAQLKISGDLNITGTDASCGCTHPVLEKINDTEQILTIIFDQYKITNNVSKFVTLIINGKKNLRINLIMNH
jgi:ABC-type xylose transport system substrate-binding protein